jgi:hypothetical protein
MCAPIALGSSFLTKGQTGQAISRFQNKDGERLVRKDEACAFPCNEEGKLHYSNGKETGQTQSLIKGGHVRKGGNVIKGGEADKSSHRVLTLFPNPSLL